MRAQSGFEAWCAGWGTEEDPGRFRKCRHDAMAVALPIRERMWSR